MATDPPDVPNGSDHADYMDTPNELPRATLNVHRPYVLALAAVIAPLHATANMLGELLHEIRVATDPIGASTRARISEAGKQLEEVGKTIRAAFGTEADR